MSLRIFRKLQKSFTPFREQCKNRKQHFAYYHDFHIVGVSSTSIPSTRNNFYNRQRCQDVDINLAGTRHYCCSKPDHRPSGDLQQLLEESTDPNVIDGEDLVYWESPPHRTNPLYKSPEQQAEEAQPKGDPRFASIILFPGSIRGSKGLISRKQLQLPIIQQMYSSASDILGFDLAETSLQGSRELFNTQVQQPAVLVASLAAVEKLRQERPGALELCSAAAGYGVGEVTALTFAGALSFEDAVHLVKVRAEAMQLTSELTASGAARVHSVAACRMTLVCSAAVEHCKRAGVEDPHCSVAAYLYPSCRVVAGSNEALSFLEEHSQKLQLKRVQRLPDSGAFHTDLMRPAADVIAQALRSMLIHKPSIRVLSTADDKEYQSPDDVLRFLPRQVRRPLRWQQTLARLYDRPRGLQYPTTYECGPGDGQLSMLLRLNNDKAASNSHIFNAY